MRGDLPPLVWDSKGAGSLVVVSFFTPGFYAREAFELMRSCQARGLSYRIEERADRGGWESNCNLKPSFLLEQSRRLPAHRLLWLDADARVRTWPVLLSFLRAPVAFGRHRGVPNGGVVYMDRGPQRDRFLETWRDLLAADPRGERLPPEQGALGTPDQFYMERAATACGLEVSDLPWEYAAIYDLAKDREGDPLDVERVPVIETMQANRWAKRLEGR